MAKYVAYVADVDGHHGEHRVLFADGKCVQQRLVYVYPGGGYYTGDGSPWMIGRTAREIGMTRHGFRRMTKLETEFEVEFYLGPE